MKPTRSPIDITNQNAGLSGSPAAGMFARSHITVGIMPAMSRFFIDNQLGRERFGERPAVGAAGHVAHE